MEQIEKQDCEFEVRFWTAEKTAYTGKVNHADLKKMASSGGGGMDASSNTPYTDEERQNLCN